MKEPEKHRYDRLTSNPGPERSREEALQEAAKKQLFQHRDEQENFQEIQKKPREAGPLRIPASEVHSQTRRQGDRGKKSEIDGGLLQHVT